jgi:hypothetical protein
VLQHTWPHNSVLGRKAACRRTTEACLSRGRYHLRPWHFNSSTGTSGNSYAFQKMGCISAGCGPQKVVNIIFPNGRVNENFRDADEKKLGAQPDDGVCLPPWEATKQSCGMNGIPFPGFLPCCGGRKCVVLPPSYYAPPGAMGCLAFGCDTAEVVSTAPAGGPGLSAEIMQIFREQVGLK